ERCRHILARYANTQTPQAAMVVAITCIIGEGNDAELLLKFVGRCASLDENNPMMKVMLGVAQYRAKQFAQARDTLRAMQLTQNILMLAPLSEDQRAELSVSQLCCVTFLACANHDLANEAEAITNVAVADKLIADLDRMKPPNNGRLAPWNIKLC